MIQEVDKLASIRCAFNRYLVASGTLDDKEIASIQAELDNAGENSG